MCRSACRAYLLPILTSVYVHRYFGCLVVGFTAAVWIAGAVSDRVHPAELQMYSRLTLVTFVLMAAFLIARRVLHLACIERERRPLRRLITSLREGGLSAERIVSALLVLVFLPSFHSAFTCFKGMIPAVNPFAWDSCLSGLDRTLHLGHLPSEWTRYCLGNAWVTCAVNFLYVLWLPLMYAFIFWQTVQVRRKLLRMQYLIAYALLWIVLGSAFAALLSSDGPCYFGRLTNEADVYAGHMAWLDTVNSELVAQNRFFGVWAVDVQEKLWQDYTHSNLEMASGISAMPSMHVAVATLMLLTAWPYGGWIRWTFFAYLLVIQVGSVHLGWHYAVDGYASIVLTLLIWTAAGKLAQRAISSRTASRHQPPVSLTPPAAAPAVGETSQALA